MAVILSLDIATSMGWAIYNADRHLSSIECGAINLAVEAEKAVDRRRLMRSRIDEEVCTLIDKYRPTVACLEQPLNFIGEFDRKPKGGGKGRKQLALISVSPEPQGQSPKKKGGPNADTAFMLNQLFAAADVICRHKCQHVHEVAPTTWQTLTSSFPGGTKERSIAFCRSYKIIIPPNLNKVASADAADAAVIAFWASGHQQKLDAYERARVAA